MVIGKKTENSGPAGHLLQMEAIVAEHETGLLRYAARILNNPTEAQDVVQNVFIKLFRSYGENMQPAKQLNAWLYKVTHNEAVDHIRREARLKLLHTRHTEAVVLPCPDGVNCPGTPEDKKEAVLYHLRKLDPREQQVVLLRLQQGLSYKEISEVTGRSVGNVGKLLHESVKKLSEYIRVGERSAHTPGG